MSAIARGDAVTRQFVRTLESVFRAIVRDDAVMRPKLMVADPENVDLCSYYASSAGILRDSVEPDTDAVKASALRDAALCQNRRVRKRRTF
jgi:hypothetical protein